MNETEERDGRGAGPAVNAFALPGGFVYVTRGMSSHLMSEALLVGILGPEIGHVTARHAVNQMSRAQLALGLGVGMILVPETRGNAKCTGLHGPGPVRAFHRAAGAMRGVMTFVDLDRPMALHRLLRDPPSDGSSEPRRRPPANPTETQPDRLVAIFQRHPI